MNTLAISTIQSLVSKLTLAQYFHSTLRHRLSWLRFMLMLGMVLQVSQVGATFPGTNGKIIFESYRPPKGGIHSMNPDGSNQAWIPHSPVIIDDYEPNVSPNGARIAFISPVNVFDIWSENVDGSDPKQLTNDPGDQVNPSWSPDGSHICYIGNSFRGGHLDIWVMNNDGTGKQRLTNTPNADESGPTYSPSGKKIAFSTNRDGNYEIYLMNVDGTNLVRLTNNSASDQKVDWSPDGSKIIFSSNRDGNNELYVMNADGSKPIRLTNNPASDESPVWSPDGKKIAFVSDRGGNPDIFVMDANGSQVIRLTTDPAFDGQPSWQPISMPHATAVSSTAILFSWGEDTGEIGYRIQGKQGNCSSSNPWETLTDVAANTTTFLNTRLLPATPYSYQVSSYHGTGSFSGYTGCASATTGAAGTPHIPMGLRAVSQSVTQVGLSWRDVSDDETAFSVYRRADSGDWVLLDTVAANVQSYNDASATGNNAVTSYHYDVRACNVSGCSTPTTSPVLPFRPIRLSASKTATNVHLTWKDKSSDESGFEIWRKNGGCDSENSWVLSQTIAADTNAYNDPSAVTGTAYAYRLRAYYKTVATPYASGYSRFTACVSVTAP